MTEDGEHMHPGLCWQGGHGPWSRAEKVSLAPGEDDAHIGEVVHVLQFLEVGPFAS